MTPPDFLSHLLLGLGVALLLEGVLYSLAPQAMQRMMAQLAQIPESTLRLLGLMVAGAGFLLIAALSY